MGEKCTVCKLDKVRELKLGRRLVTRSKASGEKQARESPNESVGEQVALE